MYVCPDTRAFVNRAVSPKGGEFHLAVGPYSGHLSNFGETLTLSDAGGTPVDTFATPIDPSDAQLYLVVSEIMYHPADPDADAEFVELMNISDSVTIDLDWGQIHRWYRLRVPSWLDARPGCTGRGGIFGFPQRVSPEQR